MLPNIRNLREISRRCQTGEPLPQELSAWLGDSLEKFLAQRCHTVDEALGLRFAQGGVPWWREEAIRVRDEALRCLARRIAPDGSTAAKAKSVHRLALRYAASAWRFDREREAMPASYQGTPNEFLWRAFKSGAAMPLGERQLRTVLSGA
ncbi:MAG TPA: hypothetical protein VF274_10145 [Alphaproteobacteria bacterium]